MNTNTFYLTQLAYDVQYRLNALDVKRFNSNTSLDLTQDLVDLFGDLREFNPSITNPLEKGIWINGAGLELILAETDLTPELVERYVKYVEKLSDLVRKLE